MPETFQEFITRDRERLHAERKAIFNQQHELETKLAAINNEMRAIDAYEGCEDRRPRRGKPAPAERRPAAEAAGGRASSSSSRKLSAA